jgi:hypothetical protein
MSTSSHTLRISEANILTVVAETFVFAIPSTATPTTPLAPIELAETFVFIILGTVTIPLRHWSFRETKPRELHSDVRLHHVKHSDNSTDATGTST